jgi:serine/threonine protein kinase
MPFAKVRNAEPIPGYRLLERLGSGGFGEVWKCEAPGGLFKAIKFVYGELDGLDVGGAQAEEELRAIERIKAIRHPFLLSLDRVEDLDGELVIVTELADKSLFDLLRERRAAGLPGIPRAELLQYLTEAAEVLDLLNVEHGLQHLDVKPHNLFLVSSHVKVADFGLVSSLGGGRVELGAITPLYASPEVFLGNISRQSDQYSLAIVYQELLTGTLPYQGKSARQLLLLHTQAQPDLSPLPPSDRDRVAQALAKDPARRFPTCLDFLRALRAAGPGSVLVRELPPGHGGVESPPDCPTEVASEFAVPAEAPRQEDLDTARSLSVTPGPGLAPVPPAGRATGGQAPPTISALADHAFLECLGSSPLMDVWRVQAPGGGQRLVKLVYGSLPDARRLEEALVRFQLLLHPALTQVQVVQQGPGRLVLLADPPGESVRDRFAQCQGRRLPGIPRDELIGYLRSSAEVLDYLYQQHSVQHLGLNPRNLLQERGRLVIDEFGLAQLFWLPAGQPVAERNLRYAAPELFEGTACRNADQFSLAVIYCEMLTGCHPFGGKSARSVAAGQRPDLDLVPAREREVLTRALAPDPLQRWPSCTELIRALADDASGDAADGLADPDTFSQRLRAATTGTVPASPAGAPPDSPLAEIIAQLLAEVGGTREPVHEQLTLSADDGILRQKFSAGVPLGTARLKLDAFRQQWYGQLVREDEDASLFHVNLPKRFWQQWIGRQPGLEVRVGLARQHALAATPIDVTVEIRPFRCTKKRGAQLLEEMGLSLLEGLRTTLLVGAEKRVQDRLLWPHALQVRPVLADGSLGEAVVCRGKDISLSGIGFYLPHELPTADVRIELPATGQTPALSVPATLVRAKPFPDGWYEVGALFRLSALRKSLPEFCLS